jgi:hypothetical protein
MLQCPKCPESHVISFQVSHFSSNITWLGKLARLHLLLLSSGSHTNALAFVLKCRASIEHTVPA